MLRADATHLGLMLLALALAYVLPFELLLLAYAILGPAHYLTEISWLHNRRYFLPSRWIAALLLVLGLPALWMPSASLFGLLLWLSFLIGVLAIVPATRLQRLALLILGAGVSAALVLHQTFYAIIAMLLPTLIHVSVFTLIFMIVGAHKAGSRAQAMLIVVYLGAIGLILAAPPVVAPVIPSLARLGVKYFGGLAPALGDLFHLPDLKFDARITGLLSFVYTYHYLNWFIKADVIGWRRIPMPRMAAIAGLSALAVGIYFYDYTMGFTVLLTLSLAHVILEFPLNAISMRQLAGIATQGLGRQPRPAD